MEPIRTYLAMGGYAAFIWPAYAVAALVLIAFAIAALIDGKVDAAWVRWVRPWTLLAWTTLTAGIVLGTFLVRSGVITSVHAFAEDPARGLFILLLLAIAIGGSFTLFAWRAPVLKGGGMFAPISREGAMVVNNLLLATATATVLLGTLYPLILSVVGGGAVSVGVAATSFLSLFPWLKVRRRRGCRPSAFDWARDTARWGSGRRAGAGCQAGMSGGRWLRGRR